MYTSIFFCFSYSLYVHPTFRRSVDIFLNAIFVFVQIDCKHFPHFTDFKLILNIVCYNMFKEHILNCPRWSHETCTKSANPFLKPKGYKCDQITVPPPPLPFAPIWNIYTSIISATMNIRKGLTFICLWNRFRDVWAGGCSEYRPVARVYQKWIFHCQNGKILKGYKYFL